MQDSNPSVVNRPEYPESQAQKYEASANQAMSAFRDMTEKGVNQAKEAYAKMKSAAEETTGVLENTYANASKGAADCGLKMIEMARANTNSAFDFAAELLAARTLAQVVEISTSHMRKQIELATEQAKELAALAQKCATDTAEPMKDGLANLAKKAA
jgi:phasin